MGMRGRVWKVADDINTDYIIAGKYKLTITDIDKLAVHAMEDVLPNFAKKVKLGDFIVAGKNFGCGSSREQAPLVLKHLGVAAVIAKSFARIFYRNGINIGLPVIESNRVDEIDSGDILGIDLKSSVIKNISKNKTYKIKPIPQQLEEILSNGGLVNYIKKHGKLPW